MPKRAKLAKSAVLAVVFVVVSGALTAGAVFSSDPSFCGRCHRMRSYSAAWKSGPHKSIGCLECHRDPGPGGTLTYRLRMVRYAGLTKTYLRRYRPSLDTAGASSACLRCHRDIQTKNVISGNGVKVRHKEIIMSGLGCARCHAGAGHPALSEGRYLDPHESCYACHKDISGSSRCPYCHTTDAHALTADLDDYAKIRISGINNCATCHATVLCGECHKKIPPLIEY